MTAIILPFRPPPKTDREPDLFAPVATVTPLPDLARRANAVRFNDAFPKLMAGQPVQADFDRCVVCGIERAKHPPPWSKQTGNHHPFQGLTDRRLGQSLANARRKIWPASAPDAEDEETDDAD